MNSEQRNKNKDKKRKKKLFPYKIGGKFRTNEKVSKNGKKDKENYNGKYKKT